jgi:hypothetical protein
MISADIIREKIKLQDVQWKTLRVENNNIVVTLEGYNTTQSFNVRCSTYVPTTLETISASCQLVSFIMRDPLLHRGVEKVTCFATDGIVHSASILFHNHEIDMLSYFREGSFDTRAALIAVLHACEESSPTDVCAISFEEVAAGENVVVLKGEEQFKYNQKHIERWIEEHGTSPFTRAAKTLDDIQIIQRVYGPIPLAAQPDISPSKRQKCAREHIVGVLDTSGSMLSCPGSVKAVEDFFMSKKEETKTPTSVTLYKFNQEVEQVLHNDDIQTFQPFTEEEKEMLLPGGMTALYDAICSAGQYLLDTVAAGENALLCVLTDGEDTSSTKTQADAKAILDRLHKRGFQCVFLAANIGDARIRGTNLGFTPETSLTFEPDAVDAAWMSLRQATCGHTPVIFSQVQRQLSAPTQFTDDDINILRHTTQ